MHPDKKMELQKFGSLKTNVILNPIMVDNYAAFFNCTPISRASRWPRHKAIHFSRLGPEHLVCSLAHHGLTVVSLLLRLFGTQGSPPSGS